MRRRELERLACEKVIRWRDANKALWPQLELLIHVPNGATMRPMEALKMIRMGMTAGVPDFLLLPTKLAIEMKTDTGQLNKAQKRFRSVFEAFGGRYVVCRTPAEAVLEVKRELGLPLR